MYMLLVQLATKKQHLRSLPQAFDRIIFNFPHVGLGIKDQVRLLTKFDSGLLSATSHLCSNPELVVIPIVCIRQRSALQL